VKTTENNYDRIVRDNLRRLYSEQTDDLEHRLSVLKKGNEFYFEAFGRDCRITPEGIFWEEQKAPGPVGIIIVLYALNATSEPVIETPFKAFKELPGSMPYAGAFDTHTQHILIPHVNGIERAKDRIIEAFRGNSPGSEVSGDFAFQLFPLPKIALCYIFYRADEDFPASATCLFSNNADSHLPTDALADVGEYTSRRIIELL
jgi:hypothetical protein